MASPRKHLSSYKSVSGLESLSLWITVDASDDAVGLTLLSSSIQQQSTIIQ
jgi:hypothetical protein